MKIITLIEDTSEDPKLEAQHGLSFYVETEHHKLLADTGASDLTWRNAEQLGVDVSGVDTVILSHGHYDHTGGALTFARQHPAAQIYMQGSAGRDYYNGERYIGIDKALLSLPQMHLLSGDCVIDSELSLFTGITGSHRRPAGNRTLFEKKNGTPVPDTFEHEQCVVIETENRTVLLSGCAHNGILNILEAFEARYRKEPDMVISGFHMMKQTEYTDEELQTIRDTAMELKKRKTQFFTGHCTGQPAFALMKEILNDRLTRFYTGFQIV